MLDTVIRFFQSGGPFMYPILVVLAIGLTITIERYIYLSAAKNRNRKVLAQIMPMLQKGEMNSVIQLTKDSNATVSKILAQGLSNFKSARRRDDIEASMEESIMEAIPRLEKRTHYLAMFANIATLLGLLGTIIGLIKAFTAVAQVDPSMKAEILSTSISVAMNTTAFGLIVAIPLLIFYTLLQTKTTEIIDSLEMATVRFVNQLTKFKNSGQQGNAQ
ncbi:MAG: MotA/TolQ/ExbB proton channel family protein [Gammaproteobacteria bacterium]|jgi:biopolymer transport protein ExbB/TolQ|nr:MotA/TolQ/ExbB proton channel family protein [Gammaproteobacteria bacterium]MBT3721934.1 MotA/TolQ/ExbB proton channel family protein [Gammaproteobacteria bacterium]MBT4075560.1 MotA/TolQ/ExbB proton channel family protein [Gammaproteobacteria bacterium]MBT4192976.1 MotA/TolQ/ExbB proton channel family protein [Gammaproteobacteria bacterium]MBT4450910.1 MotA/TolQ/ExbB proton channel family protein [Gammaproteobacteria bacterium]